MSDLEYEADGHQGEVKNHRQHWKQQQWTSSCDVHHWYLTCTHNSSINTSHSAAVLYGQGSVIFVVNENENENYQKRKNSDSVNEN